MRHGLKHAARCGAAVAMVGALLSTFASPVRADSRDPFTAPPASHIKIELVGFNGTGCARDKDGNLTAFVNIADDNTAFTVIYNNFVAEVLRDVASVRKNCQLIVHVDVPQGFTYAVASATYRGYGELQRGSTGSQVASYYFQGLPETARITHNLTGTLNDNWQSTDQVPVTALIYAPCGAKRNLNINTELRVAQGTSNRSIPSKLTMDSTDGAIDTIYQFSWIRCP